MAKNKYIIALLICFAFLPIEIFSYGLLSLSPAFGLCLSGVFLIFSNNVRRQEVFFLLLFLIVWSIIYLISALADNNFNIYKIGSFAYLISPFFAFYSGKWIVQRAGHSFFPYFLKLYSKVISVFYIYIVSSIFLSHGAVRIGGNAMVNGILTNGDRIGFSGVFNIYGSWGIHSFIDLCVINLIIVAYVHLKLKPSILHKILNFFGVFSMLYLILYSFSRESWLSLLLCSVVLVLTSVRQYPISSGVFVIILFVGAILFSNEISDTFVITRQVDFISSGNIDGFTSGRANIIRDGIGSILDSPFYGSILSNSSSINDVNTSLHNQFLTYFYKLGLLCGPILLVHSALIFFPKRYERKHKSNRLLITYTLLAMAILSIFWDVLLVNAIGTLIFFLCGMESTEYSNLSDDYTNNKNYSLQTRSHKLL